MKFKSPIKRLLLAMGYDVHRVSSLGQDAFRDMRRLIGPNSRPVVIDVGANTGQSISRFTSAFDRPIIHAFEPGSHAFNELQRRSGTIPGLYLNNCALGSQSGFMEFIENTQSEMSSFLEPSNDHWGTVNARRRVEVKTLDQYCTERGVRDIDILKSDTQGFDLEVIKGARQLLSLGRIHLIYMEIIFSDMYKGLPRLDEIYGFLMDRGFLLVSFYRFYYQNNRASWTDALFINAHYQPTVDGAMRHVNSVSVEKSV